jgi:hypothetical protein
MSEIAPKLQNKPIFAVLYLVLNSGVFEHLEETLEG